MRKFKLGDKVIYNGGGDNILNTEVVLIDEYDAVLKYAIIKPYSESRVPAGDLVYYKSKPNIQVSNKLKAGDRIWWVIEDSLTIIPDTDELDDLIRNGFYICNVASNRPLINEYRRKFNSGFYKDKIENGFYDIFYSCFNGLTGGSHSLNSGTLITPHQLRQIIDRKEELKGTKNPEKETVYSSIKENKIMEQSITRKALGEIHEIACAAWKPKIEKLSQRNPFGDTITLSDEEVEEMFKAATSTQIPILEGLLIRPKQNTIDLRKGDIYEYIEVNHTMYDIFDYKGVDALINLPIDGEEPNEFFLNANFNYEVKGNKLVVTLKKD